MDFIGFHELQAASRKHFTYLFYAGYIVQITTDRRYPQLGKGAKIQLFGVDGTTGKHLLIPSGNEHNSRR